MTGKPGMPQSMGSKRSRCDLVTEQQIGTKGNHQMMKFLPPGLSTSRHMCRCLGVQSSCVIHPPWDSSPMAQDVP